jgi:hypothetical protein
MNSLYSMCKRFPNTRHTVTFAYHYKGRFETHCITVSMRTSCYRVPRGNTAVQLRLSEVISDKGGSVNRKFE